MRDRDLKAINDNYGRKRKTTSYIYIPWSKYREAEGHLKLRSCLQGAVINYVPIIGKYINKLELYNQCLPRIVKDGIMTEIENTLCMRSFMNVTPVS